MPTIPTGTSAPRQDAALLRAMAVAAVVGLALGIYLGIRYVI